MSIFIFMALTLVLTLESLGQPNPNRNIIYARRMVAVDFNVYTELHFNATAEREMVRAHTELPAPIHDRYATTTVSVNGTVGFFMNIWNMDDTGTTDDEYIVWGLGQEIAADESVNGVRRDVWPDVEDGCTNCWPGNFENNYLIWPRQGDRAHISEHQVVAAYDANGGVAPIFIGAWMAADGDDLTTSSTLGDTHMNLLNL